MGKALCKGDEGSIPLTECKILTLHVIVLPANSLEGDLSRFINKKFILMKESIFNLVLGGFALAILFLMIYGIETKSYNPNEPHRQYIGKYVFKNFSFIDSDEKHIYTNNDVIEITAKRVIVGYYPYRIDPSNSFKDDVTGHLICQMNNTQGERIQLILEPSSDSTIARMTFTNLRTKKSKIFNN
jgi:hypothetical protein